MDDRRFLRSMLASGPESFSGIAPDGHDRDVDEYDGALRAAAALFAYESHSLLRRRKHVHAAIRGLLTSIRLLELLDLRQMGEVDDSHGQAIANRAKHERRMVAEERRREASKKGKTRKAAKK